MYPSDVALIVEESLSRTPYDVVQIKASGRRHIQVLLDRDPPEKILVNDLVFAQKLIGKALQSRGYDRKSFHIAVNSPGPNRPLTRPKDFVRFTGHVVKVELKQKVNNRKNYRGLLIGAINDGVVLDLTDGTGQKHLPFALTKSITLQGHQESPFGTL